jgi:hypothetical protein
MTLLESDRYIPETCFFLDYETTEYKRTLYIFEVVDGQVVSVTGLKREKNEGLPLLVEPYPRKKFTYPLKTYCDSFGGCDNTNWYELTEDEVEIHIIMEQI